MNVREHQHSNVAILHYSGIFKLIVGRHQFEIDEVDHVSVSGMGLILPIRVPCETPVTLIYTDRNLQLFVYAKVAWSDCYTHESSPGKEEYHVDIHFDPNDIETNVLFFMALREYLDPFTWTG